MQRSDRSGRQRQRRTEPVYRGADPPLERVRPRADYQKHVKELDIDKIIDSYRIKTMCRTDTKHDIEHIWVSGFKDLEDAYLNQLLPHSISVGWAGDRFERVPEEIRTEIDDAVASAEKLKQKAKKNYNPDTHFAILLYRYLKKKREEEDSFYNTVVLDRLLAWNGGLDLQCILCYETERLDWDKMMKDYNDGNLKRDPAFFKIIYGKKQNVEINQEDEGTSS